MKRREFLFTTTLAAFGATGTHAQARMVRIGMLANTRRDRSPNFPPFIKRLAELGYVEGKNIEIAFRSSDFVSERLPALARELVALKLDLIVAYGSLPPIRALLAEKVSLPIVLTAFDYDPVDSGIVASYNRPGGNITGAYIPQPTLAVKRLELARELLPAATRLLLMYDVFCKDQFAAVAQAAPKLGIKIEAVEFTGPPYDYAAAFARGRKAGAHGLLGMMSPLLFQDRAKIAALALKDRLPAVGGLNAFAEAGFLASYGAPLAKVAEGAAEITIRIIKGAKPADTPVEQVNEFEFAVNMKTAKALGIRIPQSVMVRADRVIE